jgi:hypothetical protein
MPTDDSANLLASTPQPTYQQTPLPAPQAASISQPVSPFVFIIGAALVGLLAILLFFREKNLKAELSH